METNSSSPHLQRMAEELKCPICLSLLKSAVSLPCNHLFCNVCIDKSMKSDSTCPVCKIPYRRREVRPAPHMDTLVNIFKSMEVSSGLHILGTQSERQPSGHEIQVENEIVDKSKKTSKACNGTTKSQNQRKIKVKTLKESLKKLKRCNSDIERPSFPTKKRIQVPLHHPQETPTRPANSEGGTELFKDKVQVNVSEPEGTSHLHENGERLFTPFFWLRNEEDAENPTQLTPLDPVSDSPQDGPCFSDIKDSEDDPSCHVTSKDVNMFDSEMFEWTQRPCSPELCATPMKMQDKESDGRVQLCENENAENLNVKQGTDKFEVVLPALSSLQTIEADRDPKVKGSNKRTKKTEQSIQKKRVKRDAGKVVGICTVSLKANQDKGSNTSEMVKPKKQNHGRGKRVPVDSSSGEALILNNETAFDGEGSGNNKSLNRKETTNQQLSSGIRRLKKDDPRNSDDRVTKINNTFNLVLPNGTLTVDSEIKAHACRKQIEKGHVPKGLKTSKKVKFSRNESSKVKSVDDIPPTSEKVATRTRQPLGDSNPTLKSSTMFLHICDNLSNMCCAFCQSTEESNISGCISHYLKGRPITLDHEDVQSAIHAHRNCTEWAPNVYFEDDIAINIEAELARSKRIKCSCCGLKGAALGCYEKSCRKSFHFTCAKLTPQCRWDDDNFVMLCPLHALHKLPNEKCGSQPKEKKNCAPKRQAAVKPSQVLGDTVTATSRWDSHGLFTKVVLCCSALTNIEKETIVKFEKLSGVTVLKIWDSRVTHVVASVDGNGACRRTLKYLMGIIEGKWILNIEWIKACMEVKKPVDEQLYEIKLDIHGFKGGPELGRSRFLNKEPRLFYGLKFYFSGDFVASYKGYLHDLLTAAGGTVLHRKPIPIKGEQQFIIYSLELPVNLKANEENLILSRRKSEAEALAKSSGAVVVSNSWVLNSIGSCKLLNHA
uniref:protein BREAST CANCER SUSCEPTIBILITY 1 homolog n=1 Tax=Erigeron canadensis TaxID=72917 RepID=UPI001CB972D0|nr:protein BREAST CANCER SUSCEPTIBILITY 1 homolog [Erigeron canadensis]